MQDLRVQSSGYGSVIPRVYGKARLSGNVIWMRGFHEETRSETEEVGGGGKGGGGDSQTVKTVSYHYYADLALGLCEGPIESGPMAMRSTGTSTQTFAFTVARAGRVRIRSFRPSRA